jgi:hypothetical protein
MCTYVLLYDLAVVHPINVASSNAYIPDGQRCTITHSLTSVNVWHLSQYDKSHPSALGLEGFECKAMAATAFKELVRRTFGLKLSGKEVAALVANFRKHGGKPVSTKSHLTRPVTTSTYK